MSRKVKPYVVYSDTVLMLFVKTEFVILCSRVSVLSVIGGWMVCRLCNVAVLSPYVV